MNVITDVVAKVTDTSFPEFDDFLNDLGTWGEHLKDFTSTAQMKSIYNFVKKEYATKTVSELFNYCYLILILKTSLNSIIIIIS